MRQNDRHRQSLTAVWELKPVLFRPPEGRPFVRSTYFVRRRYRTVDDTGLLPRVEEGVNVGGVGDRRSPADAGRDRSNDGRRGSRAPAGYQKM
jgi:hypothetical protein